MLPRYLEYIGCTLEYCRTEYVEYQAPNVLSVLDNPGGSPAQYTEYFRVPGVSFPFLSTFARLRIRVCEFGSNARKWQSRSAVKRVRVQRGASKHRLSDRLRSPSSHITFSRSEALVELCRLLLTVAEYVPFDITIGRLLPP